MGFSHKRIAVVGGGLGGMSFMNAALYAGITNIQLYEQAPEFTEVGAGVNISRNANLILDAYGLKDSMLWKSSRNPPCYIEYRNYRTGEYLGQIDEFGDPASRQIQRAHLLDVLKARVPSSMLNLGKRLVSMGWVGSGEGYLLRFADGSTAEADIVIGCDGIKSVVRDCMGIKDKPIYSGQVVYRGYVSYDDLSPTTAQLLRRTVTFRGSRRHVLTLPIGNDESKTDRVGVIGFMTESLDSWQSESWMSRSTVDSLHEHVADWCEEVQEIIAGLRKGTPDGKILKQALYVRNPLSKWYDVPPGQADSGVILLGDSAHSTLPHQGQGTGMAIESGVALATILKYWKGHSLESAFEFYQSIRKPRTDRVTKTSYEAGKLSSADTDPEQLTTSFNPAALRERMRWIMEYNVLEDVWQKGVDFLEAPTVQEEKVDAGVDASASI